MLNIKGVLKEEIGLYLNFVYVYFVLVYVY